MKYSRILRFVFGICSILILMIGMYIYFQNHLKITIYATICWRTSFMLFFFWCFWKRIVQLPRWTYIGWLPLAAAVVAWRPFLLKFAVPASVLLMFLNSPFARGKYRPKSWRVLHSSLKNMKSVRDAVRETVIETVSDAVRENLRENMRENTQEEESKETAFGKKTEKTEKTEKEEKSQNAAQNDDAQKEESQKDDAPKKEAKTEQKTSEKSKSDVRGPQAKNVMFRALSRVAGRQVGKMVNKKKK